MCVCVCVCVCVTAQPVMRTYRFPLLLPPPTFPLSASEIGGVQIANGDSEGSPSDSPPLSAPETRRAAQAPAGALVSLQLFTPPLRGGVSLQLFTPPLRGGAHLLVLVLLLPRLELQAPPPRLLQAPLHLPLPPI